MSLSHWESEDGQRAMEKMGPVWGEFIGGAPEFLAHTADGWVWRVLNESTGFAETPLACLRDHAWEWLHARKVVVVPDWTGGEAYYWRYQCQNAGPWKMVTGGHPDYDSALIAAVLAEGEGA